MQTHTHTEGRGEEIGGPRRQLIACLLCHSLVATAATATATDALPRRQHKIFRLAVIIMKGRRSFRAVAVAVAVKLKLNLLRARNFIKILLARYVCGLRTCWMCGGWGCVCVCECLFEACVFNIIRAAGQMKLSPMCIMKQGRLTHSTNEQRTL